MQINKPIGGYFELELNSGQEFHAKAIRLNTGRNALEYVLRANDYRKVYIPYYTCDAVLEPIKKLKLSFEFYTLNENFEPKFDFKNVKENEAFLYTNYFGLKQACILQLARQCSNLIIDNAQAFYARPVNGVDTFYSPRKFFGIPDGAYLYSKNKWHKDLNTDVSYNRFEALLKRWEEEPEASYPVFMQNEEKLGQCPIKRMSRLTHQLLCTVHYDKVAQQRQHNYRFLHKHLKAENKINLPELGNQVPLVYPLWTRQRNLREKLIKERIFVPRYWPNVLDWAPLDSLAYQWANEIVFLPIDQRYGKMEMENIIRYIII